MIMTRYPPHPNSRLVAGISKGFAWVVIGIIVILSIGCFTTASLQEATGEKARIHVRLLKVDSSLPVVYSEETPQRNETGIFVGQFIAGCHTYTIYANPSPESTNVLTTESVEIYPLILDDESDEHGLWSLVPDNRCALLLMVGEVQETGFAGFSLSTRDKVLKRVGIYLQKDKPGKSIFWLFSIYPAPFYDAVLLVVGTPLFGAMAIDSASHKAFPDPVTVSFDFPDGTRSQTSITYKEAETTLRRNFPALFSPLLNEWNDIRFWTRAALLKLRLDYREVTSDKGNINLAQISQYQGLWRYDPRDGRGLETDIREPLQDTRYIRYNCNSCKELPLTGIVNKQPPVPRPPGGDTGYQSLLQSAENGDPASQWHLYFDNGRRKEDWPWLCKAVDQEYGDAMVEIGEILWHGRDGIVQNRELAYCWYKAAFASGTHTFGHLRSFPDDSRSVELTRNSGRSRLAICAHTFGRFQSLAETKTATGATGILSYHRAWLQLF
jgi:hypothetical protein